MTEALIQHNRRLPRVQIPMDADCYYDDYEIEEYEFLFDHSASADEER